MDRILAPSTSGPRHSTLEKPFIDTRLRLYNESGDLIGIYTIEAFRKRKATNDPTCPIHRIELNGGTCHQCDGRVRPKQPPRPWYRKTGRGLKNP